MTARDPSKDPSGPPCPSCGVVMVFRVTYFRHDGFVTKEVCVEHDLLLIEGLGVIGLSNPNAVRVEK